MSLSAWKPGESARRLELDERPDDDEVLWFVTLGATLVRAVRAKGGFQVLFQSHVASARRSWMRALVLTYAGRARLRSARGRRPTGTPGGRGRRFGEAIKVRRFAFDRVLNLRHLGECARLCTSPDRREGTVAKSSWPFSLPTAQDRIPPAANAAVQRAVYRYARKPSGLVSRSERWCSRPKWLRTTASAS